MPVAPARSLLTPNRLDVMAAYIYAWHREHDTGTTWPARLYAAHMRAFNGCAEPDGSGKAGIDAFFAAFHDVLDSVKAHGYRDDAPAIPVGSDGTIVDGAHRLAACLLYDVPVRTEPSDRPVFHYDYAWLARNLAPEWLDAMVTQYCELAEDIHVAVLFPGGGYTDDRLPPGFIHGGRISLTQAGIRNIMALMYPGATWLKAKAVMCFPPGYDEISWAILQADADTTKAYKMRYRERANYGNHSIHITDTRAEALRLVRLFLNPNSLDWLNRGVMVGPPPTGEPMEPWACIDGSSVLEWYGLREARDLDIIVWPDQPGSHNKNVAEHHVWPIPDIIYDPRLHLWAGNAKLAALDVVRAMKVNRDEPKDRADVALIGPEPERPVMVNVVYGHLQRPYAEHIGNCSVAWTPEPVEGADVYAYADAFSYRGRQPGLDVLLALEPHTVLPGQYSDAVYDRFDHVWSFVPSVYQRGGKFHHLYLMAYGQPDATGKLREVPTGYFGAPNRKPGIVMVHGNKHSTERGEQYTARVEFARWFAEHGKTPMDVYGRPGFPGLPNYRGETEDKHATMAGYTFALAMDNTYDPEWSSGYFTREVLDALYCGCIPILKGCYDIERYLPADCYIDLRQFADYQALDDHLQALTPKDIARYRLSISDYLSSPEVQRYHAHSTYLELFALMGRHPMGEWQFGLADGRQTLRRARGNSQPWTWQQLAAGTPTGHGDFALQSAELTSIVILNYNGGDAIRQCLASIAACTPERHEVIVIDQASTDGSREWLRAQPGVRLVENAENVGVAPGRAQGMALASGEYVVLLDNDTVVTPGWLGRFIAHATKDAQIGLLGPCSNYVSGPQIVPGVPYRDWPGLQQFAAKRAAEFAGYDPLPVPRLVGFCMFITRAVIDAIGIVDPAYGRFGFEDDDYTLRAMNAGFHPAIAQDVFVHHTGGPQSRGDPEYNAAMAHARKVFNRKWGTLGQAIMEGRAARREPVSAANVADTPVGVRVLHYHEPKEGGHLAAGFMRALKDEFGCNVFVETGTFRGATALIAATVFEKVETVELDRELAQAARYMLPANVIVHHGDSVLLFLRRVAQGGTPLVWLDAHWSGEDTAQGPEHCPLLAELAAIRTWPVKPPVILMDDMRYCAPATVPIESGGPSDGFPSLAEIRAALDPAYEFVLYGDIGMAYLPHDGFRVGDDVAAMTAERMRPLGAVRSTAAMVGVLVFSKDRACQLDLCLASLTKHLTDALPPIVVLWTASNERYARQYETLAAEYTGVAFRKQADFRDDVADILAGWQHVCCVTDDTIFTHDFNLTETVAAIADSARMLTDRALGYSLRLGQNIKRGGPPECQPFALPPTMTHLDCGWMWRWSEVGEERGWGYPLEVSSSVYPTSTIRDLIANHSIANPNQLEAALHAGRMAYADMSMLCPSHSVAFAAPWNAVQAANAWAQGMSAEQFATEFDAGRRLDWRAYDGYETDSYHALPLVQWRSDGR